MTKKNSGQWKPGQSGNPRGVRRDGWASALTGIGTNARDKRNSHCFHPRSLSYAEAIAMWQSDDLARRAVESVPGECFRQGYEITIADEGHFEDLKETLEDRLLELKTDEIVERAHQLERGVGGSAILLGVNDSKALDTPMVVSQVTSIDWLTVLEPVELSVARYYEDPTSPKYGEPELYQLNATSVGGLGNGVTSARQAPPTGRYIHESRLIVFPGIRVSKYQTVHGLAGSQWGDCILTALYDVLRDFNIAFSSAGIIVTDFSQSVISIENLMALVAKDPAGLQLRMQALDMSRSTARMVLLDTKEKFERQSTSVAGLPDLLDRLSSRLAAAIDMPLALLMGQAPGTVGTEADDVRFYYDRIASLQQRKIGPILRFIASLILQTERKRKIPKKWGIRFHPLWQLTDKERADAKLSQARVDSMYIKMGALTPNEVRFSRFGGEYSWETQINENEDAPGFAAPIPHGVIPPPGTPGAPAPGTPNPNAHGVRGYTRANPQSTGTEPAAKQGGDVPNQSKEKRDEDE